MVKEEDTAEDAITLAIHVVVHVVSHVIMRQYAIIAMLNVDLNAIFASQYVNHADQFALKDQCFVIHVVRYYCVACAK